MVLEVRLLVVLLLAGHFTGDFLLQTGTLVRRKRAPAWLGVHVLLVTLAQTLFLLPFLPWGTLLMAMVGITVAHAIIDALKPSLEALVDHAPWAFVLDQVAHVAVLAGFAAWILPRGFEPAPDGLPWGPAFSYGVAVAVIAVALAGWAGAVLVELLLQRFEPDRPDTTGTEAEAKALEAGELDGAGRAVGILERLLILALVVVNAWVAVGLLLVAKAVARFAAPAEHRAADGFLVGTLASTLIAVVVGLAARAALG